MAVPASTITRYDVNKSVREELSDIIYNIDPVETPFMSNIGKGKVSNTYFEWQSDQLAAANQDNKQIEGDDAPNDTRTPTNRLANYTQIMRKVIGTSGTAEAVDKAGIKGQLSYELAKASSEIKRDMEARLTGIKFAVAGSNSVARETAGFDAFLRSNTSNGATGSNPTLSGSTDGYPNASGVPGTSRAFTETLLKTVLQSVWNNGGSLDFVMMGGTQKGVASAFAGIAQQRHEVGNKQATIIGAADVYVGDFGSVNFVPNRFMPATLAYVVDPEYAEIDYLRDFSTSDLAKTGDSQRKMLLVEFGLKIKTEKAHGVIRALT